jgi:hypothetical protein
MTQARDEAYTRPGVPDSEKWNPIMRGYTEDTEVLTEIGWISFSTLYKAGVNGPANGTPPLFRREIDWKQEHRPLRENWADNKTKHQKLYNGLSTPNQIDFTKWSVGDRFPRVATLTPDHMKPGVQHGTIVFERPEFATRFTYSDYQLIHIKRRGVDILLPRFTDILVKPKFQKAWGWTVADSLCSVRKVKGAFHSIVNRYSPTGVLYGDVDGDRILELAEGRTLKALMTDEYPTKIASSEQAQRVRIWDAYPGNTIKNSVECFNLVLTAGSSHTLIVRRKGETTRGEKPVTTWTGFPLLVGDGYDKSSIVIDKLKGLY